MNIAKAVQKRLPGGERFEQLRFATKNAFEGDEIYSGYLHFVKYSFLHNRLTYKKSPFFNDEEKIYDVYGLKIPYVFPEDLWAFWYEFADLILPYKIELDGHKFEFERINTLMDEGPYELNDHVSVKENDVVIDCGANIGIFSAIASKKNAVSYAFEPSKRIRDRYTDVTAKENGSIIVCPFALGNENGTVFFENNTSSIGSSKLGTENSENVEEVQITKLDDYVESNGINQIDFIKADIEGAERDMLTGATRILKEMAPKLAICTYHNPDDKEVLENIVRKANPHYIITHSYKKMYAYVP